MGGTWYDRFVNLRNIYLVDILRQALCWVIVTKWIGRRPSPWKAQSSGQGRHSPKLKGSMARWKEKQGAIKTRRLICVIKQQVEIQTHDCLTDWGKSENSFSPGCLKILIWRQHVSYSVFHYFHNNVLFFFPFFHKVLSNLLKSEHRISHECNLIYNN